jgi:MEMO1 family protein
MPHIYYMEERASLAESIRVREPIVEGIFYPNDRQELEGDVKRLLSEANSQFRIRRGAMAVISPHAGYPYCGLYAGSAFAAAAGRDIDTVVILAPVHREPEDAIYLTESAFFSTPIGRIPVAMDFVSALEGCSTRIFRNDIPHLEEHGIEVQLPFIQSEFPNAKIVPILMGRATQTNVRLLARALDLTFGDCLSRTLFVVSSNLSSHAQGEAANDSMHRLISLIERRDCEDLLRAYHRKDITACGSGCIATICSMSLPTGEVTLLSKTAPHSRTDDTGKIIHYGAIAFYANED